MTEQDIKGWLLALQGAMAHNDTDTASEAAMNLLEGFLVNQVRIAEALEDIRLWGTGQMEPKK